ncbi:VOC family protein [Cognatilysobacter segetis]|uniref:VOC family protein n=1 Tax=Cognatilysobacter segetis TaxID=2492394 RepID=UPI00105BAB85|nr:VOC family protein [Lysobacter segetis]
MQLIAYLAFDGDCRAAFEFYRDAFGGELVTLMTVGESPMAAELPPASHDRIMHAHLRIGDAALMGADTQPGCGDGSPGAGGCLNVMLDTVEAAERVWAKLSEGADIRMPLAPSSWATRFGMLNDRFGKAWMVNGPAAQGDAA